MEASLQEFLSWIDEVANRLDCSNAIAAYDYETNGINPTSKDFYVTIIGLAVAVNSSEAESRYIVVDSLSLSDRESLYSKFEEFVKSYKNKLYAYNASYEMKVNSIIFESDDVYEIKDTLVLATMVGKRTNLKELAVTELGVEEWSDEVSDIVDAYAKAYDYMSKPTYLKKVDKLQKEGEQVNVVDVILENKKVSDIVSPVIDAIGRDVFESHLEYSPYPWASVPRDILGKYCAMDSEYTARLTVHLLYNYFNPKKVNDNVVGLSNDEIMARRKSFSSVYMPNIYTSVYFELFGPRWKDEEAESFVEEYTPVAIECLYNIIQKLDGVSLEDKLKCRDFYLREVPFSYEVVKTSKSGEITKIVQVETIQDKLELLKSFFNPASNTDENRALFFNTYMTPRLKDAVIKLLVINSLGSVKDKVKQIIEFSSRAKEFFDEAENNIDFIVNDTDVALRGLDWSISKLVKDIVLKIKGDIQKNRWDRFDTFEDMNFRFATPVMKFHYEAMTKYLGVDIDDKSTWIDEMDLLFNIVLYKKIVKTISTNINGSLGRGSVSEVVFNTEASVPKRISDYSRNKSNLILNNSFNPLAAATHRWSSGWHTIPPLSPIRPAITVWNDGELWIHIDYSQNELVMLAFYSQDENMLQAFYDGVDLHRFVASLVFNKPLDQVTSAERRMSKAVSFAIVYGSSIQTVAINITNGDVKRAESLFDSFYNAFPRIRSFMESKNKQALIDRVNPKVTNMFGGIINLDTRGSDESAILRQSVNYPIQSASSLLAAVGINNAIKNFKSERLYLIPLGFTHDAFDCIIKVKDVFKSLDLLKYSMQDQLREEFEVPMKVDVEVGTNSGWLCELEYDKKDNGYLIEVEGVESHINSLVRCIGTEFDLSDPKTLEDSVTKGSYKPMFTTGTALEYSWLMDTIAKKKVEMSVIER